MISVRFQWQLAVIFFSALPLTACDPTAQKGDACESQICVTDFAGHQVVLTEPAKTIIALAPHIVENVYSAGAGEKLIGVFEYSNFPEVVKELPIVGGYQTTNFERIIELNPDLIIAWESGNSHAATSRLKELGFTVYLDEPKSVDDIAKSIRDIGALAGTQAVAEPTASEFLDDVAVVQRKYSQAPKVSVFYQVWNSPLQSINGEHVISDAIELCGGENIYADEFAVAPVINIESVLERDPQAIIAGGTGDGRPDWLDEWLKWPTMSAVKNNHIFHVNPDLTQRHTVRLLLGMEQFCRHLDKVRSRRIQSRAAAKKN